MKFNINLHQNMFGNPEIHLEGFSKKRIHMGGKEYFFIPYFDEGGETPNFQDPVEFIKRQKGLLLIFSENQFLLYNDPFRTIPIFVCRSAGRIHLFSNFEDFYSLESCQNSRVDLAGFWETVIFEGALGRRTLFENIRQMPAATCLNIKSDLSYSIERYWDYSIPKNSEVKTIDDAASGLFERLDEIFGNLPKMDSYRMGLSGGVDSRLALAFLNRHVPPKSLKLFTFAFDERSLEFVYAKQVAEALGCEPPEFHRLTPESYLKGAENMPRASGASVGMQHCHTTDFLMNLKKSTSREALISTALTDALFGYAVKLPKIRTDFKKNPQFERLNKYKSLMDEDTYHIISEDLKEIFSNYRENANFSCPEEYFYCTERNVKFHLYASFLYNKFLLTISPFADYELLTFCIGLPFEYRFQKRIVDAIMERYFPPISFRGLQNISSRDYKNVSSEYSWGSALESSPSHYYFKLLNRINSVLVLLTSGRVQLFNKYLTENQVVNLSLHHRRLLNQALAELGHKNILGGKVLNYFKKRPFRPSHVSDRYQLINIFKAIEYNS